MKFKDTKYGDMTGKKNKGDIDVNKEGLTSLEGAPLTTSGAFDCSSNQLTTLTDAPIDCKWFYCSINELTTLKGAPQSLTDFECYWNKLTNLVGGPVEITGSYNCSNTQITSLKGAPEEIGINFDCSSNNLTTLEGAPKKVGGIFICKKNNIKNVISEIVKNNIKASAYETDAGWFTYDSIFKKYDSVKSKGFRTLLGLDK